MLAHLTPYAHHVMGCFLLISFAITGKISLILSGLVIVNGNPHC